MMNFTLKQLEIFFNVAKYLSFTQAAHQLCLTQPAISQQIRKLEIQYGKKLFENIGRQIHLTKDGEKLLIAVEPLIEKISQLRLQKKTQPSFVSGTLRLSMSNAMQHLIFSILGKFYNQHKTIDLQIFVGNRYQQLKRLYFNQFDACLLGSLPEDLSLRGELLLKSPLILVASVEHYLAKKKIIKLNQLKDEVFIVGEANTINYSQTYQLFKLLKTPRGKHIQIENYEAIKHAVCGNLGIALLPEFMVSLEIKNGMLKKLKVPRLPAAELGLYWVQHKNKKLTTLTQLFKEFLTTELKQN